MPPSPYILVTAARNEAAHIPETLRSVVIQTLPPHRGMIVSDGSTDATDDGRMIVNATTVDSRVQPNVKIRIHYPDSRPAMNRYSFVDIGWNGLQEINTAPLGGIETSCTTN